MFHHPQQNAASFQIKVSVTRLAGWRTTMKMSFLVSVGAVFGALTASVALASTTVTTEFGRPLLVETNMSVAACGDVASSTASETNGWHDALASKRAHDLVVQASWNNALANKRVEDRALVLANTGAAPAAGCDLTN
jgi:hypothetical protein